MRNKLNLVWIVKLGLRECCKLLCCMSGCATRRIRRIFSRDDFIGRKVIGLELRVMIKWKKDESYCLRIRDVSASVRRLHAAFNVESYDRSKMLQYIDVYRQEEPQAKASFESSWNYGVCIRKLGRWWAVFELWPPRLESELSATPEVLKLWDSLAERRHSFIQKDLKDIKVYPDK